MTAWWVVLRHGARQQGRRALLLVLFLSVGGGVVLSAFIGARRDSTVVERMAARTNVATVGVLPNEPGFDWTPVAALPEVRTLQRFAVTSFEVVDHPEVNTDFPRVGPPTGEPIEGVVPIEGRRVDQSRVDEVTVSPTTAQQAHVGVGDQLTLRVLTSDGMRQRITGGQPSTDAEIEVPVHVVGIVKGAVFSGSLQTTEAFTARYLDDLVPPGLGYVNAFVRLDGGASVDEFSRRVDQLVGRPVEVLDIEVTLRSVHRATQLEAAALVVFGVTAALVVAILGAIWISRSTGASAESLPVLRALGFTRRDGVALAAAIPAAAAVVGALGATVVAAVLSARYPIGLGREIEPSPGTHVNVAGSAIGAAAFASLGVAVAVVSAVRAERRATAFGPVAAARRWRVASPLVVTIGARLALAARRDGGSRSATASLLFGVVAVVGALTFGAGLERAAADGSLSGQPFNSATINVGSAEPPADLVAAWRGDRRVVAAARITNLVGEVDGDAVSLFAVDDLKSASPERPLRGRLPVGLGEIALAPGEMRRLGTSLGDDVVLADGTSLRVVGVLFTPELGHTGYDAGGRISTEQMAAMEASGVPVKFDAWALRTADRLTTADLDDVWMGTSHEEGGLVEAQGNLGRTRQLPRALAWFAGVLAAVTAAVVLVATTRRRRREVAVLQVLGLTRRQARQVIAWQVLTSVVVAVVVGVPVGFALGRTIWQAVVDGIPLRYATPTAWGAVSLVVVGVALLAGLLASRPLVLTAADEPAVSLRAE